ncbi:MAG: ribbon-helix-helix domain-containing protein [Nanoarchaeota archaeon]
MAIELITFKLDNEIRKDLDEVLHKAGFHTRTEFIRTAIREKMQDIKMKQAMIMALKGKGTGSITDEDLHRVREKVFKEFDKEFFEPPKGS